jgi:DNA-binding transcriptional ArsR family regulator
VTTLTALEVIAEPTRRRILDLLLGGELPVGELVTNLAMSQPGVSRHLRVLRDADLVKSRADAQRRLYSINARPLAELDAWLAPYRRLWADHLDQLAVHLDDMPEEPTAG